MRVKTVPYPKEIAMKLLLAPGNAACRLAGLDTETDNGQILRMFANTVFWGTVGTALVLATAL